VHGAVDACVAVRAAFLHALFAPAHICANASQRNMGRLASSYNPASTQVDFTTQHLDDHAQHAAAHMHSRS
jgi:hypothetical protein